MNQQEFWNKKFLRDGYLYGLKPNEFIKSNYKNFNKNEKILCLGEGEGRNAIFLAKNGYEVEALDASNIGLEKLERLAKENSVHVETTCLDINEWLPNKKYGAIVFSFMHLSLSELKNLFKKIEKSLSKDAYLVLEVFSKNQMQKNSGGPKDLSLLYSVQDFEECISDLKIEKLEESLVYLDEGKGHQGEASVIRLVAQKQ